MKSNIIICGVGGQGIITLLRIIAQASLEENLNVRTSELHGLSQRGGSVVVHIKIGSEVFSPLVIPNEADLIIALEIQESLNAVKYANKNTIFLINNHIIPIPGQNLSEEQIKKELNKISKNIYLIDANKIIAEKYKNPVLSGVFLLGAACSKKFISLSPSSFEKALAKIIKPKYIDLNKKAFKFGLKFNPI